MLWFLTKNNNQDVISTERLPFISKGTIRNYLVQHHDGRMAMKDLVTLPVPSLADSSAQLVSRFCHLMITIAAAPPNIVSAVPRRKRKVKIERVRPGESGPLHKENESYPELYPARFQLELDHMANHQEYKQP